MSTLGGINLDLKRSPPLLVNGRPRHLHRRGLHVLACLIRRPGVIFTGRELMDAAGSWFSQPATARTHMHQIRHAIEGAAPNVKIRTYNGIGWAIELDESQVGGPVAPAQGAIK